MLGGKDYGYIIDYRGLIKKLDDAMDMYSGSGLENFEGKDLKGAIHDVIVIIGSLRQYYSELVSFFISIKNKEDIEEFEVFLADDKLREEFYDILSNYGRNLSIALESEKIYNSLGKDEIDNHKKIFKFYQKLRESVKRRYSDTIDNKEYEARMQKLMDNYIAAEGMMRITNPVDILDEKAFEEEVKRIDNKRSKADTIRTRLGKSISEKWDENPAYYKKFSERIEKVLEDYKNKRISEADYLSNMEDIMNKYREKKDESNYPETIKYNENAQAFYGVVNEVIKESGVEYGSVDDLATLSVEIDGVIKEKSKVDWHDNIDVHNKIAQEIDDILYEYTNKTGVEISFDYIDKIIEKVKNVALKRY